VGADGLVAATVPGVKRQPGRLPARPVAAQGDVVRAPYLPHAVDVDPVVADQVKALLPGMQALPPAVDQLNVGVR
jgi:hypothetical protein